MISFDVAGCVYAYCRCGVVGLLRVSEDLALADDRAHRSCCSTRGVKR